MTIKSKVHNKVATVCVFMFAALLSACATRSISNSGYPDGYTKDNPLYQGELTEFDVLGINLDKPISEDEIKQSFPANKRVSVKKGMSIMLVQSGAMFPDEPMIRELNKYFSVIPFSGVPLFKHDEAKGPASGSNYAKALRLAAARGGNDIILCYWGILETAKKDLVTKTVSWVPIVGWMLPDESQQMRIRLKLAIVDVRTGNWSVLSPDPLDDSALSGIFGRENADQGQVALLKEQAYKSAVDDLIKIYVN